MSRPKNKFSLFDFCKKQAGKIEVYGEETLDEEGNIIPFIEQAALITHYLHLDRKGINLPYRDKAEDILNLWYEIIRGKKGEKKNYDGLVADSCNAFQQYLKTSTTNQLHSLWYGKTLGHASS
ncbi:MAG: hypothetical protein IJ901_06030 [Bacteroidaceae bacterium]|nr:hypothetical protein [Bacteroidaceae bacterium]